MSEPSDMSTPVTRGELRLEFGELRQELKELELRLDQRVDQKLETWAGALLARIQSSEQRLIRLITSQGRELHEALARHVGALEESMRTMVSVVDDKYTDLPGRVTALENGAPPASPRKRRRRAS